MQLDHQSDFYHYMITDGNLGLHTAYDYISRLRFLSKRHIIDDALTESDIQHILDIERVEMLSRDVYNGNSAIRDFQAGLRKFLKFVNSNYSENISNREDAEEREIINNSHIPETEKVALIKSRRGQGLFRNRLFEYWHGCALTDCHITDMLIASHIKPWRDSNNEERLCQYNGLLLLPTYDKLFDRGYITFDETGHIVVSKLISVGDIAKMSIDTNASLIKMDINHLRFLEYHQNYIFMV